VEVTTRHNHIQVQQILPEYKVSSLSLGDKVALELVQMLETHKVKKTIMLLDILPNNLPEILVSLNQKMMTSLNAEVIITNA
jgi:ABC-type proline/glycine betaine transport system permease subunit